MTPAYFLATEVPTFALGELIVVSGPDLASIYVLLSNAQIVLITSGKPCPDPTDTRATIAYPSGIISNVYPPTTTTFSSAEFTCCFISPLWAMLRMTSGPNIGLERTITAYNSITQVFTIAPAFPVAPLIGDGFVIEPPVETAYKYEFLHIYHRSSGINPGVVLVGNQFNRANIHQNPRPVDVQVDTVIDLLNTFNVQDIPSVQSSLDIKVREIFSWVNRIYYYDNAANDITFIKTQVPGSPAPQIYSVTPCRGPAVGNTIVEINGQNFRDDTTVVFGTDYGLKVDVQSTVLLQCRTPKRPVGVCNVIVRNRDGQFDVGTNAFTYF